MIGPPRSRGGIANQRTGARHGTCGVSGAGHRGREAGLATPSPLNRLLARVGNPLDWSYVDKCLLVICLAIIPTGSIALQTFWLDRAVASFPNYAPWVISGLRAGQLIFVALWVLLAAIGFTIRRRWPDNRIFVVATAVVFSASLMPAAYFTGMFVSSFWISIVALGVIGSLLFPARFVSFGMLLSLASTVALLLALWLGWLPYASLLESPPADFVRQPDSLLWIAMVAANSLLFSTVVVAPFVYTVMRWRRREAELAQAHADLAQSQQRLTRATELIRRYVATQVADRVLAGGEAPLDGHERRVLTIFYSDIKGFTEASDQMDTEDLSRTLNEYLSEMSQIAIAHGGTVDKFVGDAIMIFFGAPNEMAEHEQARNAVRMAIAMGRRMEELRAKWFDEGMQFPFEKRVGINTGIASVGSFGSRDRLDYTAIGQQVNLAARLEGACAPGRILVSHATWMLVGNEIPCVPKGELVVPGMAEPVKVYEVVS